MGYELGKWAAKSLDRACPCGKRLFPVHLDAVEAVLWRQKYREAPTLAIYPCPWGVPGWHVTSDLVSYHLKTAKKERREAQQERHLGYDDDGGNAGHDGMR